MKLKLTCLGLIFMFAVHAVAQKDNFSPYKAHEYWFGRLNFGTNSFWGDVNDNTNKIFPTTPFQSSFYKNRHFVLGGGFGKMVMPFWSVQLEFKLANLSGRNYRTGQEFFSYLNNEITFLTNIDILKIANLKTNWSAYVRLGVGVYGFKSRLWNTNTGDVVDAYPIMFAGNEIGVQNTVKPDLYQYALAIPFGLGAGYQIMPELKLFFESSMTWINHDMVDVYPSDYKKFEGVWITSLGIVYQFDFPIVRVRQSNGVKSYDPALKKDNVEDEYKRSKRKSSTSFKPAKSHSKSTIKSKKAKRKYFSF